MNPGRRGFAFASLAVTALAAGCGPTPALINDVSGGRAWLLSVDGHPVERAASKYVTVVPLALVQPGAHAFRVRLKADERGAVEETVLVSARVLPGRTYRFEERAGGLLLVEAPTDR